MTKGKLKLYCSIIRLRLRDSIWRECRPRWWRWGLVRKLFDKWSVCFTIRGTWRKAAGLLGSWFYQEEYLRPVGRVGPLYETKDTPWLASSDLVATPFSPGSIKMDTFLPFVRYFIVNSQLSCSIHQRQTTS